MFECASAPGLTLTSIRYSVRYFSKMQIQSRTGFVLLMMSRFIKHSRKEIQVLWHLDF